MRMNFLEDDFQSFIADRLEHIGQNVIRCEEYRREYESLNINTKALTATLTPEQNNQFSDIDDSNAAITNLYECACYKQGFIDALKLVAGF